MYVLKEKASVSQIALLAAFNRPTFVNSNKTIAHMFDDAELLGRLNKETRGAAAMFKKETKAFSRVLRARSLDERGLS